MQNSNFNLPTFITSIVSLIIGTAGFLLSVLNYLRDRSKVKVHLKWNMTIKPGTGPLAYDPQKPCGVIRITNTGRRPIYIPIVALEYKLTLIQRILRRVFKRQPKDYFLEIVNDSIGGTKLEEGGKPSVFVIGQDGREEQAKYWKRVRAIAEDAAGNAYVSPRVLRKPSWAGGQPWPGP